MIREMLEHWLTPCPPRWRRLGYLREQIAIDARLARNRAAWEPHLEASRRLILEAAGRCTRRRCALLLGAGLQHDLPVRELCGMFGRVVLADLIHRPGPRRRSRAAGALCAEFDASGALNELVGRGDGLDDAALERLVAGADAGLPAETEGEPDLVVSANLASQLMLLPAEWLERERERGEDLGARLTAAAARRHLAWLGARSGIHVLVTEVARRRVARDGSLASREELAWAAGPGEPAARWTWRIAPIPEADRRQHLEHEVAGWVW